VKLGGFGKLHAPFFMERRTRGSLQCNVAGNPGPGLGAVMGLRAHFKETERGPFKPRFGMSGVVRKAPQGLKRVCENCYFREKPQVPPLRSPGFPVELGGFGELHAPLFTERRTRTSLWCSVAGNPGAFRSG
jgi:hypothetical protein